MLVPEGGGRGTGMAVTRSLDPARETEKENSKFKTPGQSVDIEIASTTRRATALVRPVKKTCVRLAVRAHIRPNARGHRVASCTPHNNALADERCGSRPWLRSQNLGGGECDGLVDANRTINSVRDRLDRLDRKI